MRDLNKYNKRSQDTEETKFKEDTISQRSDDDSVSSNDLEEPSLLQVPSAIPSKYNQS